MIRIEGLHKRFGDFVAVEDLNLHVKHNEVFGFLGPNGAGKTTSMKIMLGIMRPTKGRVLVDGIDVQKDPISAREKIGYIPDRPYLYEKLTGREFMHFVGGIYRMDMKKEAHRADELLELFGIAQWSRELVESYSHGMKQRLTMAAALLHSPKLVVVDEPMVGLDPRGAELVKRIFRRVGESGQGTVFLSTHTLEVAEQLCHRVAILHRGRVVAQGSMDDLREQVGGDTRRLQEIFLKLTGGARVDEALELFGL